MPLIKSAIKKMKQDKRRYAQNLRTKRAVKEAVHTFQGQPTFDTLRAAQSAIDTAAKKHVFTKPAAARRIAHLSAQAKAAGVKIVTVKKATAKPTTKAEPKTEAKVPAKKSTAKKAPAKATVKKAKTEAAK